MLRELRRLIVNAISIFFFWQDFREKLFLPYHRDSNSTVSGTGLGLAICRKVSFVLFFVLLNACKIASRMPGAEVLL